MPTTPCVGLPYPSSTDPINVPGDIQALAVAVDTAICDIVGPFLGQIMPCFRGAGWTVPAGTLVCDGSAFASVTYPELYALLGNSANTPDLRGTFLRGSDIPFPNSGDTGGTNPTNVADHTHTSPVHGHTSGAHDHDIPSHNHVQSPHNHIQTQHLHIQNEHAHSISGHSHATSIDHDHGSFNTGLGGSHTHTGITAPGVGTYGIFGLGSTGTQYNTIAIGSGFTNIEIASTNSNHLHSINVPNFNVADVTTASQSGGTSTIGATATNQNTTPVNQPATAVNTAQPLTLTSLANETLGDTAVTVSNTGTTDTHGNLPPFYGVTNVIQAVPRN